MAKACVAALLSSSRCLTPEARITTTLFVKRTTKQSLVILDRCAEEGFRFGHDRVQCDFGLGHADQLAREVQLVMIFLGEDLVSNRPANDEGEFLTLTVGDPVRLEGPPANGTETTGSGLPAAT